MKFHFVPGGWEEPEVKISAYSVSVKGRLTTMDGRPVAGAKVTGSPACIYPELANHDPSGFKEQRKRALRTAVSTISAADGTYELHGFVPPHIMDMTRYLDSGIAGIAGEAMMVSAAFHPAFVDIHVEADGLVQRKVPRVPLITEPLLSAARRFWRLLIQISADLTAQQKKDYKFEPKEALPPSEGTTITGIDIVLERVE